MVWPPGDAGRDYTVQPRYYISSLDAPAERLLKVVRTHWSIENSLHWSLDVTFGEDHCRIRKDHAPQNMATLRQVSHNLLKNETSLKVGIQGKRLQAGWKEDYLPATREQWIYDLRTNQHFTLKANPLQRHHTILNSIVRNRVYRNPTSSSPVVFKTIAFSASSTASNRRTSRQRGQLCHRRLRVCRSVEHAADGAIFHFVVGHA